MSNLDSMTIKQRILQRRQIARAQSSSIKMTVKDKLLNLHKINDTLDQVMADLSLEVSPDNNLNEAIQHIRAAADLLVSHGEKLVTTPVKSSDDKDNSRKGQYDDFEDKGAGFDSASELMQKQKQQRRDESDEADNARIEAQTDADYNAATGDTIERDSNGQFASFLKGNIKQVVPETERGYNLGKRSIWSKR